MNSLCCVPKSNSKVGAHESLETFQYRVLDFIYDQQQKNRNKSINTLGVPFKKHGEPPELIKRDDKIVWIPDVSDKPIINAVFKCTRGKSSAEIKLLHYPPEDVLQNYNIRRNPNTLSKSSLRTTVPTNEIFGDKAYLRRFIHPTLPEKSKTTVLRQEFGSEQKPKKMTSNSIDDQTERWIIGDRIYNKNGNYAKIITKKCVDNNVFVNIEYESSNSKDQAKPRRMKELTLRNLMQKWSLVEIISADTFTELDKMDTSGSPDTNVDMKDISQFHQEPLFPVSISQGLHKFLQPGNIITTNTSKDGFEDLHRSDIKKVEIPVDKTSNLAITDDFISHSDVQLHNQTGCITIDTYQNQSSSPEKKSNVSKKGASTNRRFDHSEKPYPGFPSTLDEKQIKKLKGKKPDVFKSSHDHDPNMNNSNKETIKSSAALQHIQVSGMQKEVSDMSSLNLSMVKTSPVDELKKPALTENSFTNSPIQPSNEIARITPPSGRRDGLGKTKSSSNQTPNSRPYSVPKGSSGGSIEIKTNSINQTKSDSFNSLLTTSITNHVEVHGFQSFGTDSNDQNSGNKIKYNQNISEVSKEGDTSFRVFEQNQASRIKNEVNQIATLNSLRCLPSTGQPRVEPTLLDKNRPPLPKQSSSGNVDSTQPFERKHGPSKTKSTGQRISSYTRPYPDPKMSSGGSQERETISINQIQSDSFAPISIKNVSDSYKQQHDITAIMPMNNKNQNSTNRDNCIEPIPSNSMSIKSTTGIDNTLKISEPRSSAYFPIIYNSDSRDSQSSLGRVKTSNSKQSRHVPYSKRIPDDGLSEVAQRPLVQKVEFNYKPVHDHATGSSLRYKDSSTSIVAENKKALVSVVPWGDRDEDLSKSSIGSGVRNSYLNADSILPNITSSDYAAPTSNSSYFPVLDTKAKTTENSVNVNSTISHVTQNSSLAFPDRRNEPSISQPNNNKNSSKIISLNEPNKGTQHEHFDPTNSDSLLSTANRFDNKAFGSLSPAHTLSKITSDNKRVNSWDTTTFDPNAMHLNSREEYENYTVPDAGCHRFGQKPSATVPSLKESEERKSGQIEDYQNKRTKSNDIEKFQPNLNTDSKIGKRIAWFHYDIPMLGTILSTQQRPGDKYIARVQFDEQLQNVYLKQIGAGYEIPLEELLPAEAFETPDGHTLVDNSQDSKEKAVSEKILPKSHKHQMKGKDKTPELKKPKYAISPPISTRIIGIACGRRNGILGYNNSCYLDSTLFSLYFCTNIFDNITLVEKKSDDNMAKNVKTILRTSIVNPLRDKFYCDKDSITKLRNTMLPLCPKLKSSFMDAEELIFTLFEKALKLPEFITYSNDVTDFMHQILISPKDSSKCRTVQHLCETSFKLLENLKFREVPKPAFILEMPRSNGKLVQYEAIIPNLTLNISSMMENGPKLCLCNAVGTHNCSLCIKEAIVYCKNCQSNASEFHQGMDHKEQIISNDLSLLAVICIRSSHYVAFVKSGTDRLAPWVFFDSMAGAHSEVTLVEDMGIWLSQLEANPGKYRELMIPHPFLRRMIMDNHICIYYQPSPSVQH